MMTCPIAHLNTLMVLVAIGFFRLSSMESRFPSLPLDRSGNTQEPFDDADTRGLIGRTLLSTVTAGSGFWLIRRLLRTLDVAR
jgi:hypothetical protein